VRTRPPQWLASCAPAGLAPGRCFRTSSMALYKLAK
jgi:hypothetical protein